MSLSAERRTDFARRTIALGAVFTAGFVVGRFFSGSTENVKANNQEQIPESQNYSEEGWEFCVEIEPGNNLSSLLEENGAPGIDTGPYRLTNPKTGEEQTFNKYSQLPHTVYPGEIFCAKNKNSEISYKLESLKNKTFAQKSREIQTVIASKRNI